MDLRKERTRQSIRDAFLKLRKTKPIEKITIAEISELAMINKATFYRHYEDIYQLSNELEDEVIDRIAAHIGDGTVVDHIRNITPGTIENFETLFSFGREDVAAKKQHDRNMAYVLEHHPEIRDDVEKKFIVSSILYGFVKSFSVYEKEDKEATLRGMKKLSDVVFRMLHQ